MQNIINDKNLYLKAMFGIFLDQFSSYWIYRFFISLGYSRAISRFLASVCSKNGTLPQGAATSGYLSNIYMISFDETVFGFCRERSLRFTRYADDIAISGADMNVEEVIQFICETLNSIDLRINYAKTRCLRQHTRQKVTGVVVNERLSPGRKVPSKATARHLLHRKIRNLWTCSPHQMEQSNGVLRQHPRTNIPCHISPAR